MSNTFWFFLEGFGFSVVECSALRSVGLVLKSKTDEIDTQFFSLGQEEKNIDNQNQNDKYIGSKRQIKNKERERTGRICIWRFYIALR